MRLPRPFTVRQRGRFIFVIRAYTLAAARAIIAARLADTTGITVRASRKGVQR